jgi:hypothetical protein
MVKAMQKILFFKWSWASVLLVVGLLMSACKKEAAFIEPMDPELDFKLRVMNDQGIESSTFKQGENFWLSLVITNKINETRFLSPSDFVNMRSLFRVTSVTDSMDFGQAWQSAICFGTKVSLEGHQSVELKLPWRSDTAYFRFCMEHLSQPMLPTGTYKTMLQEYVGVGQLEKTRFTKKLNLTTTFKIQ